MRIPINHLKMTWIQIDDARLILIFVHWVADMFWFRRLLDVSSLVNFMFITNLTSKIFRKRVVPPNISSVPMTRCRSSTSKFQDEMTKSVGVSGCIFLSMAKSRLKNDQQNPNETPMDVWITPLPQLDFFWTNKHIQVRWWIMWFFIIPFSKNMSLRSTGNGSGPVIRVGMYPAVWWGTMECLMAMPLCPLRLSFENPTSISC